MKSDTDSNSGYSVLQNVTVFFSVCSELRVKTVVLFFNSVF